MPTYRAYRTLNFGRDGEPVEIEAETDAEAIRNAQQFVGGADIQLWEGPRFVITLKRPQRPPNK